MHTAGLRTTTSLQKSNSSAMRCLIIAFGLYMIFFSGHVNGFEKCWNDSDCSGKNIYCLDGYCEGHCVPCQNLNREKSASGCAKKRENCGPCLPGTEAEDLTGGRKSDYCKTTGGLVNPSPSTTGSSVYWPTLALTTICVSTVAIAVFAAIVVYIRRRRKHQPITSHRRRSTAPTLRNSNKVEESVENNNKPLPFNPNWNNQMTGCTETVIQVEAQPFNVSDYAADEESDDFAAVSPSNRLLYPNETSDNNGIPAGAYQEVENEPSEIHEGNIRLSLVCFKTSEGSTRTSRQ